MASKDDDTAERFGGPGSSHQDRQHPGKNQQPTGHKHSTDEPTTQAGAATNTSRSRVSGGGGEKDRHHSSNPSRK